MHLPALKRRKAAPQTGHGQCLKRSALEIREPDSDFASCGFLRVGTVDHILTNGQAEVTTDGAWGCLGDWIGTAS